MKEIKVLHVLPTHKIGGVELAALSSLNYLDDFFDFKLAYIFNYETQNSLFGRIKGVLNAIKSIFIKTPDILITSLWLSVLVGLPLKLIFKEKITWVHFVHNTKFFHFLDHFFNKIGSVKCDYVFADSQSTKDFLVKYSSKPSFVISYLLSNGGFTKTAKSISLEEVSFIYIGRIAKQKNLELAFRVISGLKKEGYSVSFDIFGPIEMNMDELQMKINELDIHNNVSFKGIVAPNEINDLMKNYNFYLQTSAVEGMAMSVVQAMQNGLVCLVTPCGEIANYSQDMISAIHLHQGTENGILDFIAKIKLAIGDPVLYDKLSQSAFQSFSDKLSYQESMRNTIESILNQKK